MAADTTAERALLERALESTRERRSAGTRPKTTAVKREARKVKSKTRASMAIGSLRGSGAF